MQSLRYQSIDKILSYEEYYFKKYGSYPLNISYWDPSFEYKNKILGKLVFPKHKNVFDYEFSYLLKEKNTAIEKLGFDPKINTCLLAPNGTTSIHCLIQFLKYMSFKSLSILCPCYYTVVDLGKKNKLNIEKIYIKKEAEYLIAERDIDHLFKSKVLWITNPVYNIGMYYNKKIIEFLKRKLEKGDIILADECLAFPENTLGKELGKYPGFFGIYCPHKPISINGIKFSILVFHKSFESSFEYIGDISYGCLLSSNVIALKHFISNNYDIVLSYSKRILNESLLNLKEIFKNSNYFFLDDGTSGNYITAYSLTIKSNKEKSNKFLWEIMESTGTSIFTGDKFFCNVDNNFSFRINLARDSEEFRASIERLLKSKLFSKVC